MALVLADRVKDTTTTTGTGTITLSGTPPTGFQSFAVIGDTNTTYYTIAGGSQWEVGIGTYSSTGPTLSRDTVLASSTGSKLDLAAGTKDVFVTYPAGKSVNLDASNNVSALGTVTSGTWQATTVGVGYGGTGTNTTFTTGSVVFAGASGVYSQKNANFFWDNTNNRLGISTVSPGAALDVRGTPSYTAGFTSATANTYGATTSTSLVNATLQLIGTGASGATTGIRMSQGGSFELYAGGVQEAGGAAAFVWQGYSGSAYAERMRLDSAGNLGLSVTPKAWSGLGGGGAFEFYGGALVSSPGGGLNTATLVTNAYYNGTNWIYNASADAGRYDIFGPTHRWYTAPSGTAGNTVTFTQAMTLDSSGRLGIGTAAPTAGFRLDVVDTTARIRLNSSTGTNLVEHRLINTGGILYMGIDNSTGSNFGVTYAAYLWHSGNYPMQFAVNNAEKMRLSAAGGLSVGTTTDPGAGKILAAKGILPRVNAQTTTTSPWAWNSDDYDQQSFSALANALTINADAGTPTDGEKQILRFKDNGTSRTLTFTGGVSKGFRDMTGLLTVSGSNFTYATTISKTVYFGCVYNTADSRWDIIALTQEP